MLTVERISTTESFISLEPEWNLLLADSQSDTVTLTYEWILTWWEVFGDGRELYILAVRDDDKLIGIAPLLSRRTQRFGFLPYRRLEFLASGEDEADEICSDYVDLILKRGRESEAISEIVGYLERCRDEWDEILLPGIRGSSPNLPLLEACFSAASEKAEVVKREVALYLSLPDSSDTFLKGLPASLRWEIRRDLRRANESGWEMQEATSAEGFQRLFTILIELHQSRWQHKGEAGVFSSGKFTNFHRLLAERILGKGWIKLHALMVGGEPVAALHLFSYGKSVFVYQGGMVEGHALKHPGTLLAFLSIETAIRDGFSEWDFLKTQPGSYKYRWGRDTHEIVEMRIAHNNSKEAVGDKVGSLLSGLKQVKHALTSER